MKGEKLETLETENVWYFIRSKLNIDEEANTVQKTLLTPPYGSVGFETEFTPQ